MEKIWICLLTWNFSQHAAVHVDSQPLPEHFLNLASPHPLSENRLYLSLAVCRAKCVWKNVPLYYWTQVPSINLTSNKMPPWTQNEDLGGGGKKLRHLCSIRPGKKFLLRFCQKVVSRGILGWKLQILSPFSSKVTPWGSMIKFGSKRNTENP